MDDPGIFSSKDEMKQQMKQEYGDSSSYKNSAHAIWQFVYDIKIGDVVFVKKGKDHKVIGMLLYAKTDEEIYPNNVYQMSGNQITVRTLDLNLPFSEIAEQLNIIAKTHFEL